MRKASGHVHLREAEVLRAVAQAHATGGEVEVLEVAGDGDAVAAGDVLELAAVAVRLAESLLRRGPERTRTNRTKLS